MTSNFAEGKRWAGSAVDWRDSFDWSCCWRSCRVGCVDKHGLGREDRTSADARRRSVHVDGRLQFDRMIAERGGIRSVNLDVVGFGPVVSADIITTLVASEEGFVRRLFQVDHDDDSDVRLSGASTHLITTDEGEVL